MDINIVIISIFSLILNILLTKNLMPFFRANLIDEPNIRSSHKKAKPKGGGLSFILSSYFGFIFLNNYIPLLFTPLAIVGFLDDKNNLRKSIRFIFQLSTALLIGIIFIGRLKVDSYLYSLIFIIAWQIFATSFVNFTNFMDGIDGLITLLMIIFLISDSLINNRLNSLPLLVSLISFLFWNWDPSKLFMGDIGSTFLGIYIPFLIISSSSLINSIALFIISSPLWLDASTCVIRRFANGENIFAPHKKHLYQRLNQAGWSHSKVSLTYGVTSIMLAILYIIGGFWQLLIGFLVTLSFGIFLENTHSRTFE